MRSVVAGCSCALAGIVTAPSIRPPRPEARNPPRIVQNDAQSAVSTPEPVTRSSRGRRAYALSETFGWREGLGRTPRQAPSFYGVIGASIVVGLALNFIGIDPIRALYVSAILNGLAAPPLILLMLILSNSSSTRLEGGWLSDGLVGVALVVMTVSGAVYLIGSIVG